MLKKDFRLTRDRDFNQLFGQGKPFFGRFIGIRSINNGLEKNRFGVLVGLKVSKLAVERNLIKRRLKAILVKENFLIKPGMDVVLVAKSGILAADCSKLEEEVKVGFKKLNLYV